MHPGGRSRASRGAASRNRRSALGRPPRTPRGRVSSAPSGEDSRGSNVYVELLTAVDRPLELRLVHARAAGDVHPLRLVVELLLRPSLGAVRAGAQAPATAGRDVARRRARRPALRLARACPLLVDGACRDLFGALRRAPLLLLRLLHVLVLALAFRAPRLLWHLVTPLLDCTREMPFLRFLMP